MFQYITKLACFGASHMSLSFKFWFSSKPVTKFCIPTFSLRISFLLLSLLVSSQYFLKISYPLLGICFCFSLQSYMYLHIICNFICFPFVLSHAGLSILYINFYFHIHSLLLMLVFSDFVVLLMLQLSFCRISILMRQYWTTHPNTQLWLVSIWLFNVMVCRFHTQMKQMEVWPGTL
jgi:hypothetical protein